MEGVHLARALAPSTDVTSDDLRTVILLGSYFANLGGNVREAACSCATFHERS